MMMASIKLTHFDREVYEPAEVRVHVVFDTAAAVAAPKPSAPATPGRVWVWRQLSSCGVRSQDSFLLVDALTAEWDAIRQVRVCASLGEPPHLETRRHLRVSGHAPCWGATLSLVPH